MSQHARIAPSGLYLTIKCPGSVQMQEQVPPVADTEHEREGHAAHLAAMKIAEKSWQPTLGMKFNSQGQQWELDDDMLDGALLYAEEAQIGGRFEDPVDARAHIPECWGTPDYWRVIPYASPANGDLLKVVDYKYGYRHVEVFENPQLVAYALGVQAKLQLPWETPVCLTIVQPRSYHQEGPIREWRVGPDNGPLRMMDMYSYAKKTIVPAVTEALSDSPRTISGPHCVDCKARAQCPTYRAAKDNILQLTGSAQPEQMSPQAVGVELHLVRQAIKMLEGRETGLRAHAEASINAGQQIPFWHMERGTSRLVWKDDTPVESLAAMGDLFGYNLRKPPALVTPTQAKKLGLDEHTVGEYAHRPPGALKLVPDDSTQLRKVFGHVRPALTKE